MAQSRLSMESQEKMSVNERNLYVEVYNGNIEGVNALLKEGVDVVTSCSSSGDTPLYAAAQNGHTEIVQALIPYYPDLDLNRHPCGATSLYIAVQRGHAAIVKSLIEYGANIEAVDLQNRTPLFVAAQAGHVEITCILIQAGANLEAQDETSNNPVLTAAGNGHVEVLHLLILAGADIKAVFKPKVAEEGLPVLLLAASLGHTKVVFLLIEKSPSSQRDALLSDALLAATSSGHAELVSSLILAGANINPALPRYKSLLSIASKHNYRDVINALLHAGGSRCEAESSVANKSSVYRGVSTFLETRVLSYFRSATAALPPLPQAQANVQKRIDDNKKLFELTKRLRHDPSSFFSRLSLDVFEHVLASKITENPFYKPQ